MPGSPVPEGAPRRAPQVDRGAGRQAPDPAQGPLRVAPLAGPNFCASAASAPLPSVLRRGLSPGLLQPRRASGARAGAGSASPERRAVAAYGSASHLAKTSADASPDERTSETQPGRAAGTDRKGNAAQAEAAATESHAGRGAVPTAGRAVSDALLWSPQLSPAPQPHPSSLRPTQSGAPLQATCPRWKASPWPPGVPAPGLPGPPPLRVASPPTGGHPSLAFG